MLSAENIIFFIFITLIIFYFILTFKQTSSKPQTPFSPQSVLLRSSSPYFRSEDDLPPPILNDPDIPETKLLENVTRDLINCSKSTKSINDEIKILSSAITKLANEREKLSKTCDQNLKSNLNKNFSTYNKLLKFNNKPEITMQAFKKLFKIF